MNFEPEIAPVNQKDGSNQPLADESGDRRPSRRKIFKLAATAVPVVVAMSNRPAWAGNCVVPSAWISVNVAAQKGVALSHSPGSSANCGSGCSPTYWKQFYKNQSSWSQTTTNCNNLPSDSSSFRSCMKSSAGWSSSFGSLFHENFSSSDCDFAAAYISALNNGMGRYCGITNYPLSTVDVVNMYNGTYKVGGVTWTKTECQQYIQSLYNDSTARSGFNLTFA